MSRSARRRRRRSAWAGHERVIAIFRRDFALLWAGGGGALAPLGYFLGATVLVPLAMGPERTLLAAAGPPLVWIAAALAVLATLERLFQADLEDGSLDQMLLSPAPLERSSWPRARRFGGHWAAARACGRASRDRAAGAAGAGTAPSSPASRSAWPRSSARGWWVRR